MSLILRWIRPIVMSLLWLTSRQHYLRRRAGNFEVDNSQKRCAWVLDLSPIRRGQRVIALRQFNFFPWRYLAPQRKKKPQA